MRWLGRLSDWLFLHARAAYIVPLLLVVAGFYWTFNFSSLPLSVPSLREAAGGKPMLDLRLWYSPDEAYALMRALGASGRAGYLNFLALDCIFLMAYGAGFAFLVSALLRRASWTMGNRGYLRYANLLPVGVALADALEDVATLAQLLSYPHFLPAAAVAGGAFTLVKHVGTGLSLVLIGAATLGALKRQLAE